MDIPLDEVIYFDAISSSSTGAATDADSTPTFAVYEESTDTDIGIGGNMTKRTSLTGNYRGSFTASAANGFELGKWYSVIGSATIGGIAAKGVLKSFRIVAAESIAGYPKVDEHALKGDAQSATDLKDFADDGYNPSTHKVQGVVLVDTTTTNTDMRGTNGANTTAPDNAGIATAAAAAASAASSASTAATNTTTILSRIGAITGSGVNTILGFFKALLSKTATTPSDIGGTFDPATDSTEAVRDAVDTINTGAGSGARTVTLTVDDGTDPLENANVRVTQGAETYVQATNASGQVTFSLDDATWTVVITKPLYTFTSTTIVVDGNETATYSMTAVSIPSSSAGQVTGYVYCYDEEGVVESGVSVNIKITVVGVSTGYAYDGTVRTGTSDANGLVSFTGLFKGATYKVWRGVGYDSAVEVDIASDATSPVSLTSFIGET